MELYLPQLVGGAMIGAAASLLMLGAGRIFGVSGIVGGLISSPSKDSGWRWATLLGFLAAGAVLVLGNFDVFGLQESVSWPAPNSSTAPIRLILAGILVGFGTRLGNGCTSGHGVCGISRFSKRSIAATVTFIAAGAITVFAIISLDLFHMVTTYQD